jgi:hypothetical protein
MTYNWCHGPECHTQETQSRVRGSGENKVLRTIKIKAYQGKSMFGNGGGNVWDYFCNHRCLMDFVSKHTQAIVNIAPRREPLETPVKVEKEKYESYRYDWNSGPNNETVRVPYMATRTTIKSVDNDNG